MNDTNKDINIISIFESIDGEVTSFHQGAMTTFIRLAKCNLRCIYCDTTYSFVEGNKTTVNDVYNAVAKLKPKKVTITGGEPLLQSEAVDALLELLVQNGYLVSVETNGTMPITRKHEHISWVFDYKLPSSKMEEKMQLSHFKDLSENDWVKFVINNEDDFKRALAVRKIIEFSGSRARFAYSPVFGVYPTDKLVDDLMMQGEGDEIVSLQLHKVIWPNCGATEER